MVTPNVLRPIAEWRDPRHRRGVAAELAGARFLAALGYSILAHRYRLGHHDVDLVARKGPVVAFVEVKARRSEGFGSPVEAIGWRKRLVLELVAAAWIARQGRPGDHYRFDLVGVSWGRDGFPHIFHIEDAWRSVRK